MKRTARSLLSIAMTVCIVGAASSASGQPTGGQREVLALYASGPDAQISIIGDRDLRRILQSGLGGTVDYYSEYLDTGRFPDDSYQAALRDLVKLKYGKRSLDLVIAMDEVGLEFLTKYRADLFPETPVVFLATGQRSSPLPNATGLIAEVTFDGTLDLLGDLQPDVTEVFVVTGAAAADKIYEELARTQLRRFEPRLKFTYLSGLRTAELEERIAALPPHSILYYLLVYQDGAGETFHPLDYMSRLSAVANRPMYSWVDSAIDRGVVGGSLRRLESQVAAIARISLRVLQGEPAASIPVTMVNFNGDVVDWRQLRRWGISEARVPVGTQILHRERGVWDQYKFYIIGTAALVAAQTGLIAGLLVQAARRRRAEAQLSRSQKELRSSDERNRDLGARLLGAQEAERSHIARELHDDVSQQAALLSIDLQALGDISRNDDKASELAQEALSRTERIARSLHDLSHRLHPAKLRLIGLVPSLNSLQREVSQQYDVAVTFTHQSVPADCPHDLSLCLYRIVQEALQNAVKHGGARTISINLTGAADRLTLLVADDGRGFDVEAVGGRGLGLVSMSERVEPLGGFMKIHSRPGAGTRLEVSVPLPL